MMILYDFSWNALWSNIILLVPSRIGLIKCCCSMFHMFFYEIKFQMIFFSKFIVASQRHGNDSLWFLLKCLMIKHHTIGSITNWVDKMLLFNVSHVFLWDKVLKGLLLLTKARKWSFLWFLLKNLMIKHHIFGSITNWV